MQKANKKTMSTEFVRPDYVGGTEDIAVDIFFNNLEEAKRTVASIPAKYQPHSLLMFRGVIIPEQIDYENLLKDKNISFERLSEKAQGIFYNEEIYLDDAEKKQHLQRFLREEPEEFADGQTDWKIGANALKKLLQERSDGKVYFRDIENVPLENGSLLSSFTSHISMAEGNNVPEMPGINTPMYYVGGKLSYTTHHEEDGGLSSLNILRNGSPKVWFIISHQFRAEVEKRFTQYLREKCRKEKICMQALKHKIYVITPILLDEWKIPYSFVVQRPGDCFFIKRGTYHAVINLGKNFAESVNYGCDEWVNDYEVLVCDCMECRKNDVEQDKTIVIARKELKKRLYECNEEGCQNTFTTRQKLQVHRSKVHMKMHTCTHCQKQYNRKNELQRHLKVHDPEPQQQCKVCGKYVLRLKLHIRRTHSTQKSVQSAKNY